MNNIIIDYLKNNMKIHKVDNAIIILPKNDNFSNLFNYYYKIININNSENKNLIINIDKLDKPKKQELISKIPRLNKLNKYNQVETINNYITNLNSILLKQKLLIDHKNIFNNLNHQFKTPLNGLSIGLQILDESLTDEYHKKIINNMYESCIELSKYLHDIIDYYLLVNKKIVYHNDKYNIINNINQILNYYKTTILDKKIIIKKYICNKTIFIDKQRLNQILYNIIDNSIKYTKDQINIKIWNENNTYYFNIYDNGNGIPISEKQNIFKPFYQYKNNMICNDDLGLGLGLTISSLLINAMKGNIKILSCTNEFNILFSINSNNYNQQLLNNTSPINVNNNTNTNINKILIVEDNIINSNLLLLMIQKVNNCKITIINDSTKVLNDIYNNDYDLIFLDIKMPKISGYDILNHIKQNKPSLLSKIIIITALISNDIKVKLNNYNLKKIIYKPIQIKCIKDILSIST